MPKDALGDTNHVVFLTIQVDLNAQELKGGGKKKKEKNEPGHRIQIFTQHALNWTETAARFR